MDVIKRFWMQVNKTPTCWNWIGYIDKKTGYGFISIRCKNIHVHRYSWILENGEIPEKLCICHTCDNRICVNPLHMFLGTREENRKDCINKKRQAVGEKIHSAKLNVDNVRFIRLMSATMKKEDLAKQFNVNKSTIQKVISGKTWKHLVKI